MHVISRKRIKQASAEHGEWQASLTTWYKVAKAAAWNSFDDVRKSWRNSDSVGTCVVFDIANNRCRLIAYINYRSKTVFILHVLSHAEYDRGAWKNDCTSA